jgi:peptidoglycan/LPS O-acetylase OafA/YrhL
MIFLSKSDIFVTSQTLLLSQLAIQSFFIISGFLIFMSYENSSDVKSFLTKRFKRIYPGYFLIILLCTFLGILHSHNSFGLDLIYSAIKYLVWNLLFLNFLQPTILGVFSNNPIDAINGALWTLKIEVIFYLSVPIIVFFLKKHNSALVFIFLYIFSLIYSLLIKNLIFLGYLDSASQLAHQFPAQVTYFSVGGALFYYYELFKKYILLILSVSIFLLFFKQWHFFYLFQPLILGCFIVTLASIIPYLGNFCKYGDLSYGVYIIHFPAVQYLISIGFFEKSVLFGFISSILVVLSLAFLLWHLVEKRFLKKSSSY